MEIDDEVRAITEALGEGHGLPQLTARGVVATCTACGGIMGARDRHCPSCGAAAGDEAHEGLPPAIEEPTYDDEIAVHQAADDDEYDGYEDDAYDEPDDDDGIEDAEEVATDEQEAVGVGPQSGGAASNGGSPPPWAGSPPQSPEAKPRPAIVPRAQRTLRAGRRMARHWIEERRSGGS